MGKAFRQRVRFVVRPCSAVMLAGGVGLSAITGAAWAANVAFLPVGDVAKNSNGEEIENSGTYGFAWNAGGGPTVIVNGVEFLNNHTASTPSGITIIQDAPNAGTGFNVSADHPFGPAMGTLIDSAVYSGTEPPPSDDNFSLVFNGLTLGTSYRVQFVSGHPSAGGGRLMEISSGGSSTGLFSAAGSEELEGNPLRHVIGFFTADDLTQEFVFQSPGDGNRAWLNAASIFEVEDLPLTPTWNQAAGGSWLENDNWLAGLMPNGAGSEALFGSAISQPRTVFTDGPVTLGTATFDNANMYLLAGTGSLTLQGEATDPAQVNVLQGTHKINLPLIVASNTTLEVADGATLLISDPVTVNSNINLAKSATGTVTYESTVTLQAGASVSFDSSQHVAALTVGDNAAATMLANGSRVLEADNLNISSTGGKLDLTDNKMVFRNQGPGTFAGGAYDGPSGLVDRGRGDAGNAQWNGSGIVTSDSRASNNGDLVSIGVAQVSDVRGIAASATTTFAGETVAGSDTIAMVTWGGDANLDGKINIDDYGRIDGNVGQSGSVFGWSKGDFNYDGKINIDDYGIIDGNINRQGAAFSTAGEAVAGVAAVPEPATVTIAASLALGAVLRRRRR